MKLLFIHNSLAEYRLDFWRRLSKYVELTILVTSPATDAKIYGLEKDVGNLAVVYFSGFSDLKKRLSSGYDRVILPPSDSVRLYVTARFILRFCLRKDIPVYYWSEKWEPPKSVQPLVRKLKNAVMQYMIHTLGAKCTRCIAAGSKAKLYLESIDIPEQNISVAFDSSTSPFPSERIHLEVRPAYAIPQAAKLVLYLGRLMQWKGIMVLLQAFKRLSEKDDAVWLLVAGDGEMRSACESFVKENSLARCVFAGKVQPAVRRAFFAAADVFCLPSNLDRGRVDIWGLTVNESLECGTPVIATDAVGASYDVLDEATGTVVPANSVDALAAALRIWTAQKKTENVVAACKARYEQFSTEQMARQFFSALEGV